MCSMNFADGIDRGIQQQPSGLYRLDNHTFVKTTCAFCGEECFVRNDWFKKGGPRFCNRKCKSQHLSSLVDDGERKKCPRCGKWKLYKEYSTAGKHKKCSTYCKPCQREYAKSDVTRKARQRYVTTPEYREKRNAYLKRSPAAIAGRRRRGRVYSRKIKNRIAHSISLGMQRSFRAGTGKQGRPWETLVGYTREELMEHLESQFQDGMSWDNYGEWHIDHVVLLAYFDYASVDDVEFKDAWSLDNLQPLWAFDNQSKGARYIG